MAPGENKLDGGSKNYPGYPMFRVVEVFSAGKAVRSICTVKNIFALN